MAFLKQTSFKFWSSAAPTGHLILVPISKKPDANSDNRNIVSHLRTYSCQNLIATLFYGSDWIEIINIDLELMTLTNQVTWQNANLWKYYTKCKSNHISRKIIFNSLLQWDRCTNDCHGRKPKYVYCTVMSVTVHSVTSVLWRHCIDSGVQ